jgi:hypothetical protein
MTALAVVGTGLVTPLARTPAEHALFIRAEVGAPAPGGFANEKGEPIPVAYCPWLGAHPAAEDRLVALAKVALADALDPLRRREGGARVPLAVLAISSAPRVGLGEPERKAFEAALASEVKERAVGRLTGEAGFFEGLGVAQRVLQGGAVRAVLVIAADSYVTPAYLAEYQHLGACAWDTDLPRPSEGAAAVLLTTPDFARREGVEVLATIRYAATRHGEASDENDVLVDGADLAALLRGLPGACRPIGASFGPHGGGALREREWNLAAARSVEAFDASCACLALENTVGALGAASGAANFVYGLAVHRYGAWPVEYGPRVDAPFIAWGISRNGIRGIAAATRRGWAV